MASRPPPSPRQRQVLQWIADGCPDRDWPDETHKNSARALANRGLAEVVRRNKVWTATITDAGQHYLRTGELPAPRVLEPIRVRGRPLEEHAEADATVRALRRARRHSRQKPIKQAKRQITEVYMRYRVVVTRVQVAERMVRAPSEEEAAKKVQEEFERPYGYFGSWKTVGTELEIVEAEETTAIKPAGLSPDGPMLLSIKDAASALGISRATLYEMTSHGDLDYVLIGSRKLLSREKLLEFIDRNTHNGYVRTRF